MSKAVITWNLNDRDENQDFKRCIKSKDMATLLWELKHNGYKNCVKDSDDFGYDDLFTAFEYINKLFEEYNVDIDDLID
jgi:hypothetical protein